MQPSPRPPLWLTAFPGLRPSFISNRYCLEWREPACPCRGSPFPLARPSQRAQLGLAAGLAGLRPVGIAAAIGLVLFFICALYTHVRAHDYGAQFGLANGFLALNVATLALALTG